MKQCNDCGLDMPLEREYCPHCGRPRLFPNVDAAATASEREALQHRYDRALAVAAQRHCEGQVKAFEAIVTQDSQAVMACELSKLMPMGTGDRTVYLTFYELAQFRFPTPPAKAGDRDWDRIRAVCETALFGDTVKRQIHYAALSIDGRGLPNYGKCTIILRTDMIAHRASVFEENNVLFMKRHGTTTFESDRLPKGYRSTWNDRGRLCVAKLADKIKPDTNAADFAELLIEPGENSLDDAFVEVHIFGPMTFHTFKEVTLTTSQAAPRKRKRPRARQGNTRNQSLREALTKANVVFKEV